MTQVTISNDGKRCRIVCKGHATGSPATCNAISTLLYTLAGWLLAVDAPHEAKLEPGDAVIDFSLEGPNQTAFELIDVGFRQLAQSYGEYVSIRHTATHRGVTPARKDHK